MNIYCNNILDKNIFVFAFEQWRLTEKYKEIKRNR